MKENAGYFKIDEELPPYINIDINGLEYYEMNEELDVEDITENHSSPDFNNWTLKSGISVKQMIKDATNLGGHKLMQVTLMLEFFICLFLTLYILGLNCGE